MDEGMIELRIHVPREFSFSENLHTYQDRPMNVCSTLLIKKFIEHLLSRTRHS